MMGKAVKFDGGWEPGEKVVARRVVDQLAARGDAVGRAKAGMDGSLEFKGLAPGAYHLTGESGRQVRVTVKSHVPTAAQAAVEAAPSLTADEVRERLARTRPSEPVGAIVAGEHSTASRRTAAGHVQVIAEGDTAPKVEMEAAGPDEAASGVVAVQTVDSPIADAPKARPARRTRRAPRARRPAPRPRRKAAGASK